MEPASSPTLRTGKKVGSHRIQGISDEFIPSIVDLEWLDPVVDVHDGDSIILAQKLARETKFWLTGRETLYQWGNEPYFYFYTGKSNPTVIWGQHATTSEFKDRFTKRILKDLKSNPPDLVVVHALFATESPDHEVLKWIKANYYDPLGGRLDKEYRYYLIHIRKGSELARRVKSGAIRH